MGYYKDKVLAYEYIEKLLDKRCRLLEIEVSIMRQFGFSKNFLHTYLDDVQSLRKDFVFKNGELVYDKV